MFNEYPYRNIEDLNLDYLQARVRNLEKIVEQFVALESVTFHDPIKWNITTQYAKNVVVLDDHGNAFISKKPVPAGVYLNNGEYWLEVFNFMDYVKSFNSNLTFNIEDNTDRASVAYSVGDWLLLDDVLYKVLVAIPADGLFIVGTNIEHFTVEDFIKAWINYANGLIVQYKNDIDASELLYRQQLAGDIANTTASLQAQLDAAIAGATVDSEVINARVGANGYTYSTLGDAIRGQIGNITEGHDLIYDIEDFKDAAHWKYAKIDSNGDVVYATNAILSGVYTCVNPISILKTDIVTSSEFYVFKLSGGVWVNAGGGANVGFIKAYAGETIRIEILTSAHKLSDCSLIHVFEDAAIHEQKSAIPHLLSCDSYDFLENEKIYRYKVTSTYGLYQTTTAAMITRDFIPQNVIMTCTIDTDYLLIVHRIDDTNQTVTSTTHAAGTITLNLFEKCDRFILQFMKQDASAITPADISHFSVIVQGLTDRVLIPTISAAGSCVVTNMFPMYAGYVRDDGVTITVSSNYYHTDFIKIPEGVTAIKVGCGFKSGGVQYHLNPTVAFYDSSKNVISVATGGNTDFVMTMIPINAVYLRFNQISKSAPFTDIKTGAWFYSNYYRVDLNGNNAHFDSITDCFLYLKDDETEKVIEIYEGNYDIYQEYIDANVPIYTGADPAMDFVPYCVFVPKNSHVIGKGYVRIYWMPTIEDNPEITWKQCSCVSPINVLGSMTLENVEIHCKNGRYCIHNDTIGLNGYAGTHLTFKNVTCYKYANEVDDYTTPGEPHQMGFLHTIGYGLNKDHFHEYHDCEFYNEITNGWAFYGHANQRYNGALITAEQSGRILVDNCIINSDDAVCASLGNTGLASPLQHILIKFDNCYFSGKIRVSDTGDKNAYDITFMNCDDVELNLDTVGNIYAPKAYRTNLTIT